VHQVALENIRDVAVEESEGRGFTLRHGRDGRLVRLTVRMKDKRVVALAKTDAAGGAEAVEQVANHLRTRMAQVRGPDGRRSLRPMATGASAEVLAAQETELRQALIRLRHEAAAGKRQLKPTPSR
jgi:hypothetical protein